MRRGGEMLYPVSQHLVVEKGEIIGGQTFDVPSDHGKVVQVPFGKNAFFYAVTMKKATERKIVQDVLSHCPGLFKRRVAKKKGK